MAHRNLPEMPCGPILELRGQRQRFHVPFGLKPMIEEMTREVLKEQPEDVFEFLAAFLEERLRRKQEQLAKQQRRKSWEVHRWSWEASSRLSSEALHEFLDIYQIQDAAANHYATIIQATYRGHHARDVVKEIRRSREIERRSIAEAEELKKSLEAAAQAQGDVFEVHEDEEGEEEQEKEDEEKVGGEVEDDFVGWDMKMENEETEEEEQSDFDPKTYEVSGGSETELESFYEAEPIVEEPPEEEALEIAAEVNDLQSKPEEVNIEEIPNSDTN